MTDSEALATAAQMARDLAELHGLKGHDQPAAMWNEVSEVLTKMWEDLTGERA